MNLNNFFTFPHPVNEFTARIVAGIIACVGILTIITIELQPQIGQYLLLFLTYGFIARTLWGPRFSPIALLSSSIILGILVVFASIESILGFCTGCFIFQYLMKIGLIPQTICAKYTEIGKK